MATLTTTAVPITTGSGLHIGTFHIEEQEHGRMLGTFDPGKDYPQVQEHFLEFESLVNDQILSLADEVGERIDSLGLLAEFEGMQTSIRDVQIYSNGGASFQYTIPQSNGFHH